MSSPDEDRIELRQAEAVKLRIRGKSYRAIAAELGVSLGQAFADVHAVLDRTKAEADESVEQARAIDLERIDKALDSLETIIESGGSGMEGSDPDETRLKAFDRLVKLQDHRAKLLGLYAPEKKELTGADGAPIAIDARGALLERLASLATPGATAGATSGSDRKPE
jgi:hypothetical protein